MEWSGFFAMGGYAAYVWSAYAVALVVLGVNALIPHRWERQLLKQLAREQGRAGERS